MKFQEKFYDFVLSYYLFFKQINKQKNILVSQSSEIWQYIWKEFVILKSEVPFFYTISNTMKQSTIVF